MLSTPAITISAFCLRRRDFPARELVCRGAGIAIALQVSPKLEEYKGWPEMGQMLSRYPEWLNRGALWSSATAMKK
jgi:hypothetical protein